MKKKQKNTHNTQWDALMLESYNLKKHVETIRQQLSHALYQYDAACRVIARLTQERDRSIKFSFVSNKPKKEHGKSQLFFFIFFLSLLMFTKKK